MKTYYMHMVHIAAFDIVREITHLFDTEIIALDVLALEHFDVSRHAQYLAERINQKLGGISYLLKIKAENENAAMVCLIKLTDTVWRCHYDRR